MHNGNKPNPDELPTSAQLIKSTIYAAVAAVVCKTRSNTGPQKRLRFAVVAE